ncbi:MAG: beta strand repeat-containing protein, partial [Tepidisphaeraceae bacterium]
MSPKLVSLGSARRVVALAAAATLIGTGVSLGATSYTYVGSSTGDVNVSTNWTPNGVPSGSANDIAVFDGTVAGTLTLTNSGTVTTASSGITLSITSPADLTIDSVTSNAPLWRLGNTALTVASGAGNFWMGNNAGSTVSVVIGGSGSTTQTFTNNSSKTTTIGSDILFTPGGNGNHVMAFTGSGAWTLNNAIDNTGTDKTQSNGLFAVSKSGSGAATLNNNANNYSGNTTITGGTLHATANNALGFGGQYSLNRSAGITTVDGTNASATLDLGGASTVNEPIVLNGSTNGVNLINSNTTSAVTIGDGVAAITFSNAGSGYAGSVGPYSPVATFSGGGGTGAAANAWKGGGTSTGINVVFMTNAGSGYTSAPTVTITGTNGATDAVATAVLSSVTLTGTNNNIGGDGNLVIAAGIKQSAPGGG